MTNEEVTLQKENMEEYIRLQSKGNETDEIVCFIVDEGVIFIPDDIIPGFITTGSKPGSFKLGNICLDLKKTLFKTMEWSLGAAIPDSKINALRLVIATALWIAQATKEEITDTEVTLLEWMSSKNLYNHEIDEEEMIEEFSMYCANYSMMTVSRQTIIDSINHLYKAKCIDIVSGNIRLCERVWGRR